MKYSILSFPLILIAISSLSLGCNNNKKTKTGTPAEVTDQSGKTPEEAKPEPAKSPPKEGEPAPQAEPPKTPEDTSPSKEGAAPPPGKTGGTANTDSTKVTSGGGVKSNSKDNKPPIDKGGTTSSTSKKTLGPQLGDIGNQGRSGNPKPAAQASSDSTSKKTKAPQAIQVSGLSWIAPGQKFVVLFPKHAEKGATFLSRNQNTLSIDGSSMAGNFPIAQKAVAVEGFIPTGKSTSGSLLELAASPITGLPMMDLIPARYRRSDGTFDNFFVIRSNGSEATLGSVNEAKWEQVVQRRGWTAYLMSAKFEGLSELKTAGIEIQKSKGDEIRLTITPSIENQPRIELTASDLPNKAQKSNGKKGWSLQVLHRVTVPNMTTPVLVGIIKQKNLPDIWFVGLPTEGAA